LLEEAFDARNLIGATDDSGVVQTLSQLRSRRGFRRALAEKRFDRSNIVAQAFKIATSPVSRGLLLPRLADADVEIPDRGVIGEILSGPLRNASLGSDRHLALVEAIRRLYKQAAIAADRADKLKAVH
jgi:hypothetical protein